MCLALAVFRAARRFWAEFNDPLRVREWPGELWRAEDECASLLERDAEPYRRDEPSNRRRPTLAAEALELGERDEHARRTAFGLRLVYEGSRSGRRMAVALRSACVRALIASDSLQREDDITNRRQARAWHTLAALWPGETTGPMRGPEMTPGEWAFQAAFEREWLELPTDDASQRRRACEVLEDIARLASREMRDILDALDIYSDEPRARATVGAGWSGLRRDWVNRLPARLTEPRGW